MDRKEYLQNIVALRDCILSVMSSLRKYEDYLQVKFEELTGEYDDILEKDDLPF